MREKEPRWFDRAALIAASFVITFTTVQCNGNVSGVGEKAEFVCANDMDCTGLGGGYVCVARECVRASPMTTVADASAVGAHDASAVGAHDASAVGAHDASAVGSQDASAVGSQDASAGSILSDGCADTNCTAVGAATLVALVYSRDRGFSLSFIDPTSAGVLEEFALPDVYDLDRRSAIDESAKKLYVLGSLNVDAPAVDAGLGDAGAAQASYQSKPMRILEFDLTTGELVASPLAGELQVFEVIGNETLIGIVASDTSYFQVAKFDMRSGAIQRLGILPVPTSNYATGETTIDVGRGLFYVLLGGRVLTIDAQSGELIRDVFIPFRDRQDAGTNSILSDIEVEADHGLVGTVFHWTIESMPTELHAFDPLSGDHSFIMTVPARSEIGLVGGEFSWDHYLGAADREKRIFYQLAATQTDVVASDIALKTMRTIPLGRGISAFELCHTCR